MTIIAHPQEIRDLDDERTLGTAIYGALEAWWYVWQYGTREDVTDSHEQLARSCEAFFTPKGEGYVRER